MTSKQILTKARDLLDPDGAWIQEEYYDTRGYSYPDGEPIRCYCAIGALSAAVGHREPTRDAIRVPGFKKAAKLLVDAAGRQSSPVREFANNECEVLVWNDAGERTQRDVLAAFGRAIEAA